MTENTQSHLFRIKFTVEPTDSTGALTRPSFRQQASWQPNCQSDAVARGAIILISTATAINNNKYLPHSFTNWWSPLETFSSTYYRATSALDHWSSMDSSNSESDLAKEALAFFFAPWVYTRLTGIPYTTRQMIIIIISRRYASAFRRFLRCFVLKRA